MKEQLISLETAILAYELGFTGDRPTTVVISWVNDRDGHTKIPFKPNCFLNGEYHYDYVYSVDIFKKTFKDKFCVDLYIPTQGHLQKWLRDIHNINVSSNHYKFGSSEDDGYYYSIGKSILTNYYDCKSETYEEALEQGLIEGLKRIKT